MTQHLLRTSNEYTLMVSDRLVSGGIQDPLANKNLIYQARDAIVVMGYAGAAYELNLSNKNMPTDEWIAEKLWGRSIQRGPDGLSPAGFTFGPIGHSLYIGQALKLLQSELQKSFQKLQPERTFNLTVAGWRQSRVGLRFMLAQIIKSKDMIKIVSPPRYIYRFRDRPCLISFPSYMSKDHFSEVLQHLPASPDDSEKLFVEEIRNVSLQRPDRVGPHCLSILLPPPGRTPIRVRFIPTLEHTAIVTNQSNAISKTLPVAFSPWIIGPAMLGAPLIMNGSNSVQMGQILINLEAPPHQGVRIISSLRRPPIA